MSEEFLEINKLIIEKITQNNFVEIPSINNNINFVEISNKNIDINFTEIPKININAMRIIPSYIYRLVKQRIIDSNIIPLTKDMILKLNNNNVNIIDIDGNFSELNVYLTINMIGIRQDDTIIYFKNPIKQLYRITYSIETRDLEVYYSKVRPANIIHDNKVCYGNLESNNKGLITNIVTKIRNAISVIMLPNIDSYFAYPLLDYIKNLIENKKLEFKKEEDYKIFKEIYEDFESTRERDETTYDKYSIYDICNDNEKCLQYAREHYDELF